MTLRSN